MASVFIEAYRSYDIYFNSENERFYTEIDSDARFEKQSFSSCKKGIDDYIKDNNQFKPFKITKIPDIMYGTIEIVTVIGIRKDGRFIIEKDGKKQQFSEYDERYWMLYNPENEKHYATIAALELKINEIRNEIKEEQSKIKGVTVKSIKANYIQ